MAESFTCKIWIAGDYQKAKDIVRQFCYNEGACFSLVPIDYIYTGGEESGVCVTRINYGRFPTNPSILIEQCSRLGYLLAEGLFQKSFSLETPESTIYYTNEVPALAD